MALSLLSLPTLPFRERDSSRQRPWSAAMAEHLRSFAFKAGLTLGPREQECEVARFIDRNGGRLTDSLEREIGRRFGTPVL